MNENGGGGGIRTPDPLRDSGFQDRRLEPDSATPPHEPYAGSIRSSPPMYDRSTAGIVTDPSASW